MFVIMDTKNPVGFSLFLPFPAFEEWPPRRKGADGRGRCETMVSHCAFTAAPTAAEHALLRGWERVALPGSLF